MKRDIISKPKFTSIKQINFKKLILKPVCTSFSSCTIFVAFIRIFTFKSDPFSKAPVLKNLSQRSDTLVSRNILRQLKIIEAKKANQKACCNKNIDQHQLCISESNPWLNTQETAIFNYHTSPLLPRDKSKWFVFFFPEFFVNNRTFNRLHDIYSTRVRIHQPFLRTFSVLFSFFFPTFISIWM